MIDLYAEGKTYYSMKKLFSTVNKADGLNYGFFSDGRIYDLKFHRYYQKKLNDGKLMLYPSQLLVLARYYMFHDPENEGKIHTYEETKAFLENWITALHAYVDNMFSDKTIGTERIKAMSNSTFQVPMYDSTMTLDVIAADAARAGALDCKSDYPDPAGLLFCSDSTGQTEVVQSPENETEDQRKERIYDFWKSQLAKITEIYCESLGVQTRDADAGRIRTLSHSAVVHTMLVLMIYYAQLCKGFSYLNKNVEYTPSYQGAPFFLMDVSYLCRSLALFSTNDNKALLNNIKNCFGDLMSLYIAPAFNQKNTFAIRYYRDNGDTDEMGAYQTIKEAVELPTFAQLDMGGRMYEKEYAFYGISLSAIEKFLNAIRAIKPSDNNKDMVAVPWLVLESKEYPADVPGATKAPALFSSVLKNAPYYSFSFGIEDTEKKALGKTEINAIIDSVTARARQYCMDFESRVAQTSKAMDPQTAASYKKAAERLHNYKKDATDENKALREALSALLNNLVKKPKKKSSGEKINVMLDNVHNYVLFVWKNRREKTGDMGYLSDVELVAQLDNVLQNKLIFSKELSTDLADNMTTIVARCLTLFKLLLNNWAEFRQCEDKSNIDADAQDQFVLFQAGHCFDFNAIDSSLLKEEQDFKSSVKAGLKGDADNGEKE